MSISELPSIQSDQDALYKILMSISLSDEYCRLFEVLHHETESCVHVNSRRSPKTDQIRLRTDQFRSKKCEKVSCSFCSQSLFYGRFGLRKHAKSVKHYESIRKLEISSRTTEKKPERSQKYKFAGFIVQNNPPC